MPELPEVERVRRTLEPALLNQTIVTARVFRRDVIRGGRTRADLLAGRRIVRIDRLGKQLALVAQGGRCVCIHLGMSGSLRWRDDSAPRDHVHVRWTLAGGTTLQFRDPRRFGGIWTFDSEQALHRGRWSRLGPDALSVTPAQLQTALAGRRLALKAALLDQALLAGLGNIYVDELLFACGLSPLQPACTLDRPRVAALVRTMRRLLRRAIEAGGSTLRDYVDGDGAAGGYQNRHRVYGRGGEACHQCAAPLAVITLAGRTTVHCPACQPVRSSS